MKVEIGNEKPGNFKEAWPGEYDFFSHFEHCAIVPQVLCMITTTKENGKPNACFHSGATFMGDSTGYYVLLPGICNSHTYDNILRDKQFSVNFLSSQYYSGCKKTVHNNEEDIDEILIGGFTSEPCKTIDGFRIKESILSFECKLDLVQDVTGNGQYLLIGKVELAIVDEDSHKLDKICGEQGFMYHIPSPQSPLTEERMPTAAASLTPFYMKEWVL